MRKKLAVLVSIGLLLGSADHARPQQATLNPPDNRYFMGRGSWGQNYADQWGLHRIGFDASANSAWRLVKRNAQPVIVAVIDSGLDWNHRNISWDNIWRNQKEVGDNGIDDDKNRYVDDLIGYDFIENDSKPWDYTGHGTFVAGIIAADWKDKEGMAGINPFARLMSLKAINNFGHSRASYVAEAIAYAADHGARVINLSLGSEHLTQVETEAIDYAYAKGVVLVIAAGNEGVNVKDLGIASLNKALVVAATDLNDKRTKFSNWGQNIAVAAPGVDILSLRARRTDMLLGLKDVKYTAGASYVGADKRYYRTGGTSFSAPFVAGLASLMLSNDPSLTNVQVMNIIKSTARDIDTPGVDQYSGYGLINARAALRAPKDYFLFASISGLEVMKKGAEQVVRVYGTANTNAFASAKLEVGIGPDPKQWKGAGSVPKAAGPNTVLADIPARHFAGSKVWQIRVVVRHNSGASREARFNLNLN